jgi:hypothetical protein
MPIILATQEVEIMRIIVQRQSWANSLEDPCRKYPIRKGLAWWLKRYSVCLESVSSEFKPQPPKKRRLTSSNVKINRKDKKSTGEICSIC